MFDYDIVYFCFIEYMFSILWCFNIVVFDNWNWYWLFYIFDDVLVCCFFVYLYFCMVVKCNGFFICMFYSFCIFYCENVVFILVYFYFYCNWFINGIYYCRNYFVNFIRIEKLFGFCIVFCNFWYRIFYVNINNICSCVLIYKFCCFYKGFFFFFKNLKVEWFFMFINVKYIYGFCIVVKDCFVIDYFSIY